MSAPDQIKAQTPDRQHAQEAAQVAMRILEALLFASAEPLQVDDMRGFIGEEMDIGDLLARLQADYAERGVNLVCRDNAWAFRTAPDLGFLLRREQTETRPLSRAALETLAIIAYHQPVTRAEIEEVRGVETGRGTLDLLMQAGFIHMRGRRRTPGRPVTYGTTPTFLDHFGLETLRDLPGLEELKGSGLLSGQVPADLQIPMPFDGALREDEEPLEEEATGGDQENGAERD